MILGVYFLNPRRCIRSKKDLSPTQNEADFKSMVLSMGLQMGIDARTSSRLAVKSIGNAVRGTADDSRKSLGVATMGEVCLNPRVLSLSRSAAALRFIFLTLLLPHGASCLTCTRFVRCFPCYHCRYAVQDVRKPVPGASGRGFFAWVSMKMDMGMMEWKNCAAHPFSVKKVVKFRPAFLPRKRQRKRR